MHFPQIRCVCIRTKLPAPARQELIASDPGKDCLTGQLAKRTAEGAQSVTAAVEEGPIQRLVCGKVEDALRTKFASLHHG